MQPNKTRSLFSAVIATRDDIEASLRPKRRRVIPTWVRLPRGSRACPYCHLDRTALLALITPSYANSYDPPVRSKAVKKPGGQRAHKFVHYQSLMDYLGL